MSGTTAEWSDHTLEALRRAGYRAGGARAAVVEQLADQECCLTAQEIFDHLRDHGRSVGIASVYRVLDVLVDLGLVQRIDVGDGAARFEPAYPSGEHHHHLLCSACGDVVAFEDAGLERAITRLGRRLDAVIDGHDVVLHGLCASCKPAAGA